MICAILLAGSLSLPGRGMGAVLPNVFFVLGGLVTVLESIRIWQVSESEPHAGLDTAGISCLCLVLIFSLLPMAAMVLAMVKRAPIRPALVGILILIGGIGAGELGITLHCPIDNLVHVAVWHHLLPLVPAGLAGALIGFKLFRW
jgi:hypothetical protein